MNTMHINGYIDTKMHHSGKPKNKKQVPIQANHQTALKASKSVAQNIERLQLLNMHCVLLLVLMLALEVITSVYSYGNIYFPISTTRCDSDEQCIRFSDCKIAVESWKSKKPLPKSCGFEGKMQYVCCSKSEEPKPVLPQKGTLINIRAQDSLETFSDKKCLAHHRFTDGIIVGGTEAVDWEFIFMAVLRWGDYKGPSSYNCGGVLISPNFVLTAAHCTVLNGLPPNHVRVGGERLTEPPVNDIKISKIFVHPKYDPVTNINDIALLELEENKFFAVGCLWHSPLTSSETVTAIGYGQTLFAGAASSVLRKVNLTLFSNEECEKLLKFNVEKTQICAGDWLGERDTCQGDSGGPIFVKIEKEERELPYIVGITSYGGFCAGGLPAVYTRVSEFRKWIESIVWNNA